jgi:2-polyprenyl-3-methyl-5-hydroxy-6-metoxy-1,4-benzoquinol methylase
MFAVVEDRLRYAAGAWDFLCCSHCKSAVLSPFPTAETAASFYPSVYCFERKAHGNIVRRLLNGLEYHIFFRPYYRAQARHALRHSGIRCGRALDLGCGKGHLMLALSERGFQVHGIDFHPEAIDEAGNRPGFQTVRANVACVADVFDANSFDIITAFHLFEHVVCVNSLLSDCYKLLKPGGWLIAAVPLVDSFQARLFKSHWLAVTEAPRHVTLPSHEGLRIACEAAGFESIEFAADSLWSCAAVFVLSLLPAATTNRVYGHGTLSNYFARVAAAALLPAAMGWCLVENHVLRRPAAGIVYARKPAAG